MGPSLDPIEGVDDRLLAVITGEAVQEDTGVVSTSALYSVLAERLHLQLLQRSV